MAFDDLGKTADGFLELGKRPLAVRLQLYVSEDHHVEAELMAVEERHALLDDAGAFELFDPPPNRRLRGPGAGRDLRGGERGIGLKESKNCAVDGMRDVSMIYAESQLR